MNQLFRSVRHVLLISFLTLCSLRADAPEGYVSEKAPGEYDQTLKCYINVEGICETEYVGEVLELCKDCDIPTPEVKPPSGLKVWATKWGIALFYALNDAKNWVSQKIFGDCQKQQSDTTSDHEQT